MQALSTSGGYTSLFGVTSAAGSQIPSLDSSEQTDIAAALKLKNSTALNGVMNQIMGVSSALVSPLSSRLSDFANITRSRAELSGLATGFDHEATTASFKFNASSEARTTTNTVTTPGAVRMETGTRDVAAQPIKDVVQAQGGTLKQKLNDMQAGDSIQFDVTAGGKTATINLTYEDTHATSEAQTFTNAVNQIQDQLDAQDLDVMAVQHGDTVDLETSAGSGISVAGTWDTLDTLGFVTGSARNVNSAHDQDVTEVPDPYDYAVSGNTQYSEATTETYQYEVRDPDTTTTTTETKQYLKGGDFSLNGMQFHLEEQELSVSADASAEDIQKASNEAAFEQISEQFAAQSTTNDAAGWGKLEAPTLGDDGISFKSAYKGSHATISFNGSGGSGQAAGGTDASIAAGSIEINGVKISYAAKTFEATAPGQDETAFHRQASEHIRNAINARSSETNVVAGVGLDNSLSLVSSLTGSRSMIKLGDVSSSSATGFTTGTKAASLSAAIVDLQKQGVMNLPSVFGSDGKELDADALMTRVSQQITANATAALQAQTSALDPNAATALSSAA